MNDLEERLRSDLQAVAGQVEDRIDAEDALLAGQRARSARRIARTVGVTALAAVLGMVGWGVLRAVPVLGGHPDPMGTISAMPSVPSPSESSSPYVPTDPMAATFHLGGKLNGQVDTYDSIGVSVTPAGGGQIDVTVSFNEPGRTISRHFTMLFDAFWSVALDKRFVLSIVPGRPTWFGGADAAVKGSITYPEPLTGINATAYLTGYLGSGGPDTVRGFLWRGTDGVAHDSLGNVVPSAEITIAGDTYWVYRDAALDVMGVNPNKDAGGYSYRLSEMKAGALVHGGFGTKKDKGTWTWTQLGTVPPGAHDIKLELAETGGEWRSATLADGWVFVLARAETNKTNVITSITYTGADGKVINHLS